MWLTAPAKMKRFSRVRRPQLREARSDTQESEKNEDEKQKECRVVVVATLTCLYSIKLAIAELNRDSGKHALTDRLGASFLSKIQLRKKKRSSI
jgi:hypothetical protein